MLKQEDISDPDSAPSTPLPVKYPTQKCCCKISGGEHEPSPATSTSSGAAHFYPLTAGRAQGYYQLFNVCVSVGTRLRWEVCEPMA